MKPYQTFQPTDPALDEALAAFDCNRECVGAPMSKKYPVAEVLVTDLGWVEVFLLGETKIYVPSVWGGWGRPTVNLATALLDAGLPDDA